MVDNGRNRSRNRWAVVSSDLDITYVTDTGGSAVMSLGQWENSGTFNRMGKSGPSEEGDCEL